MKSLGVSQYFHTCVLLLLMRSLFFLSIVTSLFIPTFRPYTAGLHHSPDDRVAVNNEMIVVRKVTNEPYLIHTTINNIFHDLSFA